MQVDFHGKRVLILQDSRVAGAEIAAALVGANATVLGPCDDLGMAELQVIHSDLAILDINIRGRRSFALADRLLILDVPYVFVSAHARSLLPARFAKIDYIARQTSPLVAIRHLDFRSRQAGQPGILGLLPLLRQRARTLLEDSHAADRPVERTLHLAIKDHGPLPPEADHLAWLQGLMDLALQAGPAQFLN